MIKYTGFVALIASMLFTGAVQAENLLQVYEQARLNDPGIREAEANMMAEMQAKPQARSVLLPQLGARAGYDYAELDGSNTNNAGGLNPIDTETTTTSLGISLNQTLFNTEQWQRLKRSDKEVARAAVDYKVAQQDLMVRVAEAYFDVLAAQDQLGSERAAKEAIGRQLEQANRRFEVGLIAITDVKESQAAYDDAIALEIAAQRQLASAKEALREITGQYPQTLANPGDNLPLIPPAPQIEQQWVDISLQQNVALESAKINMDITRDNVKIARGGHWPTLDLDAVYGKNDNDITNNILPAFSGEGDQTRKSIGIQLNFPIFSGGGVSADAKEQVYRHRAARENYEKVARQTERDTRDAYLGVIAEIARVQALARSEDSNQTALEATEAGYDVGTRTTVDVLNARQSLFLAQTQYARSKYDYLINVLRLKQAAGTITEDDVRQINGWLVVKEELPATPGRGSTPDVQMEPGTERDGAALELPGLDNKPAASAEAEADTADSAE